ncbi:hypothetical protein D3C78_1177530 [compost metagenome]
MTGDEADAQAGGAVGSAEIHEGNGRVIVVNGQGAVACEWTAARTFIIPDTNVAVLAEQGKVAVGDSPAPADAERLVVVDVGFDDARLDHHLTHRNVQLGDDAPQLVQTILGEVGDQAVGTVVKDDRTAHVLLLGPLGKLLEQASDVRSLGIVQLHHLATQRRQLGDLLLRLQLLTFARGDFVGRRHQQNVTDLALV